MPTKPQIQASEALLRSALDTILSLQREVVELKEALEAAGSAGDRVEIKKKPTVVGKALKASARRGVPNTFRPAGGEPDFGAAITEARKRQGPPS